MGLDELRARWIQLQTPSARAALTTACRQNVVEVVLFELGGSTDHRPELELRLGQPPSRHLSSLAPRMTRHGLDAAGRTVLVENERDGRTRVRELLTWSADGVEILEIVQEEPYQLTVVRFDGARPIQTISTYGATRLDGQPAVGVASYRYGQDGEPRLAMRVHESGSHPSNALKEGPHWGWSATRFMHDDAGRLASIEHLVASPPARIAHGQDAGAAFSAADEAFARGAYSARLTWDGRLSRREQPLADRAEAFAGIAAPLADAIHEAIVRQRQRQQFGRLAFVDVRFGLSGSPDHPAFPTAALAGVTFRDRARSLLESPAEVLAFAHRETSDTAQIALLDSASPELLRELRRGVQAFEDEHEVPERVTRPIAVELARELNARNWGETDPTFIALVRAWTADSDETDAPTRAALGDERVDAFVATLTPCTSPIGDRRVAHSQEPDDERVTDRASLAALLERSGIPNAGARLVAQDAAWAIVLEPGGDGSTRIGGSPQLPLDARWPTTDAGVPLTHLATIATDELPDVEGRAALPTGGRLELFADISDDCLEPIEPDGPNRDQAAVIFIPDGTRTHEVTDMPALGELAVTPRARLQLPEVFYGSAVERYGIDAVSEHVLARVVDRVNGRSQHQLLGFPSVNQGDPRGAGDVALLFLGHAPELGFDILDGGDLLFFGSPEDIRGHRWDRLTIWTSGG